MLLSITDDRRQGRRYLVTGKVVMSAGQEQAGADLINLGAAGLLAFSDSPPPLGERLDLRLQLRDYPFEVEVKGRVVHAAGNLIGIGFLEEVEALDEVLLWLEAGFLACLI